MFVVQYNLKSLKNKERESLKIMFLMVFLKIEA